MNNDIKKAKEALKTLRNVSFDDYHSCMLEDIYRDELETLRYFFEQLEDTKQTITPPTEEEVCKALSKYNSDDEVVYLKETKEFYNLTNEFNITETYDQEEYTISMYLPPHLITMIGQFYSSLEEV